MLKVSKLSDFSSFDPDNIDQESIEEFKQGRCFGDLTLYIDNRDVFEKTPIDVEILVRTLQESGEFELLVCGCGIAGCSGYSESLKVEHDGDIIRWNILQGYEGQYEFDRNQYYQSINKLLVFMVTHDLDSDLGVNSCNTGFYEGLYEEFKKIPS